MDRDLNQFEREAAEIAGAMGSPLHEVAQSGFPGRRSYQARFHMLEEEGRQVYFEMDATEPFWSAFVAMARRAGPARAGGEA